jgi:hypothetical protein
VKPWEREVLEYRPRIGMTPTILSEVIGKPSEAVFKPSVIAQRSAELLATDIVDNLFATLSRANDILTTLDKCLKHDSTYNTYRQAKDTGDTLEAERIHLENVADINGKPQMDVLPLIEDLYDEMQVFVDFINDELFDGKANFDDTAKLREEEEKAVNTLFIYEANGQAVNYDKVTSRLKVIAALMDRAGYYQSIVDQADEYLKLKAKDYVADDVEGLLYYLSNVKPGHLDALKETLAVSFRENASHSVNMFTQLKRAGEADVRKVLDTNLSAVRKKFHDVYETLRPYIEDDTMNNVGAHHLKQAISIGAQRISDAFDGVVVEHVSNSTLNTNQMQSLFAFLKEKRKAQSFYQLVNLFQDEFDPVDLDREIQRFIKQYRLKTPGTYCG